MKGKSLLHYLWTGIKYAIVALLIITIPEAIVFYVLGAISPIFVLILVIPIILIALTVNGYLIEEVF